MSAHGDFDLDPFVLERARAESRDYDGCSCEGCAEELAERVARATIDAVEYNLQFHGDNSYYRERRIGKDDFRKATRA